MKALQRENDFLLHRLEVTRKMMSQCRECRGSGGSMIGEDECEELGLFYSEYSPRYHDPNRGYEYWCEACIGTGNSLSNDSYI